MPWSRSTETREFIRGKNNVCSTKWKRKKRLHGFSHSKSMTYFEAFLWNFSSSTNPEIVRSGYLSCKMQVALSSVHYILKMMCHSNKYDHILTWEFHAVRLPEKFCYQVGLIALINPFEIKKKKVIGGCKKLTFSG